MRIGIVTQSYLPIHGGVAEHVHHTAEELRRRGHDVKVITTFFDRGDENFSDNVYRIGHDLTLPLNGAFVNMTVGTALRSQLREIEEHERFDIVHIHGPFEPVLPIIAMSALKAPKVGTFHMFAERSPAFGLFSPLIRRFGRRLAARIAVSNAAKEFATRYFGGEYIVIPNGVDIEKFSITAAPLEKFNDGIDTILFVGRMDPRKGLRHLLQAFPYVLKACPNTRLVVVGGGFLAGYYKRLVRPEIRDRVLFEGYASGRDLPRYYASSKIFCSPATSSESFGIVLIEAMAAGKPVVAYGNRGYRTVLGGENPSGVLVENKSVPALALALVDLLKDPRRQAELGKQGIAKAAEYAWPKIVEQIEGVYTKVLGE